MTGFSNENIKDKLCGGCDCTGFAPSVGFAFDRNANTITFTDTTVYPAGDAAKIVHLEVRDKNAKRVVGNIPEADVDNAVALNVAGLDYSGGLVALVTVVTNKGCISDGHADAVGIAINAGNIGYWDKDNNSNTL